MSKLDKILVVDVEATCWEQKEEEGKTHEIIEIGLCELKFMSGPNKYFIGARKSFFVTPHYSKISEYCEKLTGISQTMLDQESSISFEDACRKLRYEYNSDQYMWASYGDYDCYMFARQCKREHVKYPFSKTHMNVKNLFALLHQFQTEVGMTEALRYMEISLEGNHHRAGDDAYNIAKLFAQLLNDARGEK